MSGGAALGAQVARVSCDSRGRGADRWPMGGPGCAEHARTAPAGPAVRVQGGSGGQERQVERVPVSLDTAAGGGSSRWPLAPRSGRSGVPGSASGVLILRFLVALPLSEVDSNTLSLRVEYLEGRHSHPRQLPSDRASLIRY